MKNRLISLVLISLIGLFFYQNIAKKQTIAEKKANKLNSGIGKKEINLSGINKTKLMVALAFGQSNSANYGETRYDSTENVYNFSRGKVYLAADPLVGAEGINGSVWTRLGDKLIKNNLFQNVIFVPIGVGGSTISQWSPGGVLYKRLINNIRHAKKSGLKFTHLLWHQGETDNNPLQTSKEKYQYHFKRMLESIRKEGVDAPIYISIASISNHSYNINNDISKAQRELINNRDRLPGPNTDTLGLNYRYDGIHFSSQGLDKYANLWLNALSVP